MKFAFTHQADPRSFRLLLAGVVLCVTTFFAPSIRAESLTELYISSPPGDYVGQGMDYFYRLGGENHFRIIAMDYSQNGLIDNVRFSFQKGVFGDPDYWGIDFENLGPNEPFGPGYYPDARRAFAIPDGHPGLDVSGHFRGCNMLTGSFHVIDVKYSGENDVSRDEYGVSSFAATFEQRCEGFMPPLTGHVYYNYTPPAAVPEPATMLLLGTGLAGLGGMIKRSRQGKSE